MLSLSVFTSLDNSGHRNDECVGVCTSRNTNYNILCNFERADLPFGYEQLPGAQAVDKILFTGT